MANAPSTTRIKNLFSKNKCEAYGKNNVRSLRPNLSPSASCNKRIERA
jgi:hypothetical protein